MGLECPFALTWLNPPAGVLRASTRYQVGAAARQGGHDAALEDEERFPDATRRAGLGTPETVHRAVDCRSLHDQVRVPWLGAYPKSSSLIFFTAMFLVIGPGIPLAANFDHLFLRS